MEMLGTVMKCFENGNQWNAPIDRICNLDVVVYLEKGKIRVGCCITKMENDRHVDASVYKEAYWLHIDWTVCHINHDKEGDCRLLRMSFDTAELALIYLDKLLKDPFVDLLRCRLDTQPSDDQKNEYNEMKAFYSAYKHNEKIKFRFDECCVCYALTETKTSCNHALCISCCQKIIDDTKKETKDDDCHDISCPMCRDDFEFEGY